MNIAPNFERAPAVDGPRPLCPHCGVVAPRGRSECSVCDRRFPAPPVVAQPQGGDAYWVAVRCRFQCRSCGFLAPLDHLDLDGSVDCAQCGLRQAFDVDSWKEALELAHAVGDLAGPAPEGRAPHPSIWIGSANPFRDVGVSMTTAEYKQTGMVMTEGMMIPKSLIIEASPGHPVCRKCNLPVACSLAPGRVETRCQGCGSSAVYSLSNKARELCPGLLAAVADEHRGARARMVAPVAGGVVSLACPGCGAPIQTKGQERVITCAFCNATSVIPTAAIARSPDVPVHPQTWWLAFAGVSAKRLELEIPPIASQESNKQELLAKMGVKIKLPDQAASANKGRSVEEAPEEPGRNYLQLGVTVLVVALALALTYPFAADLNPFDTKHITKPPRGRKR